MPQFNENVLICIITVTKVRGLLLTSNNNTCGIVSKVNEHRLQTDEYNINRNQLLVGYSNIIVPICKNVIQI